MFYLGRSLNAEALPHSSQPGVHLAPRKTCLCFSISKNTNIEVPACTSALVCQQMLAWSRDPHHPREEKMPPLENIPGGVSRQHGIADVPGCHSYKPWCWEGVHMHQMFLLFCGLQTFRLEMKERNILFSHL